MAFEQNRVLAYELATALQSVGASINERLRGDVQFFNEQGRTPDENLQFWERQFAYLFEILPTLTDPAQISNVSNQLLDLNRRIFDAGPQDLQQANAGIFAENARAIGEIAGEAISQALFGLEGSQEGVNGVIQNVINDAAREMRGAGSTMLSAAEKFERAVTQFVNAAIRDGSLEVIA